MCAKFGPHPHASLLDRATTYVTFMGTEPRADQVTPPSTLKRAVIHDGLGPPATPGATPTDQPCVGSAKLTAVASNPGPQCARRTAPAVTVDFSAGTVPVAGEVLVVVGTVLAVRDELLQPETRTAARTRTQLRQCTLIPAGRCVVPTATATSESNNERDGERTTDSDHRRRPSHIGAPLTTTSEALLRRRSDGRPL